MDAQELIQVNLQLPASVLDSLTRLTEQLRLLTAQAGRQERVGTGQTLEQGENFFLIRSSSGPYGRERKCRKSKSL